jgi:hypothetical protein
MEEYLKKIHADNYHGLDDNMSDDFDNWLFGLSVYKLIAFADDYANEYAETIIYYIRLDN